MLIHAKNIQKKYPDGTVALNGVSLDITKGEFVAIMGHSGSGKSTLLHVLGFLDRPTGGVYSFEDKKIDDYSDDDLAVIRNEAMGFVFQTFNLLGRTSVLDNVKLPLIYSRIPQNKWDTLSRDAIEAVGLSHRLTHSPAELSGGERQRVAIARALVNNPRVIFADEPTGNLDSVSGKHVMELFETLHKKHGHTIVLITHEEDAANYAHRRVVLKDGEIIKDSPTKK